jgi:hypothetical protein
MPKLLYTNVLKRCLISAYMYFMLYSPTPPVTTSVLPGDLRLATGAPPESPKQVEQPAVTRLTASSLPEPQKQVQLPAVTTPRTATKTVLSPGGDYFLGTLSAIFSPRISTAFYLMLFFT